MSRDGLVGRAVRSIGAHSYHYLFLPFSHYLLPSLWGVEDDGGRMMLGVGLVGQAAWLAGLVT